MSEPTLYHFHLSYAAQVARLGLVEKGMTYKSFSLNLFEGEHYKPWYMEINPDGVVPTLVHGDKTIAGSLNIVRYAEAHGPGASLIPEDDALKAVMEEWIQKQQAVPEREVTYALMPGKQGESVRSGFPDRIKILEKFRKKNPQLADVYNRKIEDLKQWEKDCNDPATVQSMEADLDALLDAFNEHMADKEWVVGDFYSLADVVWTVLTARMFMMGLGKKVKSRPNVLAYLERVKARPSFAQTPVYDRVDKKVAAPLFLRAKLPFLRLFIGIKR